MSTPTPRFCTVTLPDGTTCPDALHARGKCYTHYHDAYNESRRRPGARRARNLGASPIQFALWVPYDLGRAVKLAVKEARRADPSHSEARWLEAAIRAQLERERRAPPPPGELVGALQDRCHEDSGPVRPGRSR